MRAKRNESDDPKRGMIETPEGEHKYFERYPDDTRLTLEEVMERSREKAKVLVSK